ncbi:MAG: hypothetical protein J7J52_07130 [Deltaproteobacteria bacterium]|nr:hypothetical protein [Deltaproteobacteria bacterium]
MLNNKINYSYPVGAKDFWHKTVFDFIKPEEYSDRGIDPSDIPAGTFAALKHPSQLLSRFGGNAYGFGLIEAYGRLEHDEIQLMQSVVSKDTETIRKHYKEINRIYKKMGLLIRASSHGEPYYLIPAHLISMSLDHIVSKVKEISKIVAYHRNKYYMERYNIGIILFNDDLILQELSLRFKEYNFVPVDSLEKLRSMKRTLDLFVLTGGIYEIVMSKKLGLSDQKIRSKNQLDQHVHYVLSKIYNLLKPDGEIFVIARCYTPRTNQTTTVVFNTAYEAKKFVLFSHIFKTRKRYTPSSTQLEINVFDFQSYLNMIYVEQEVVESLLNGRRLDEMTFEDIAELPYLDFPIPDRPFLINQDEAWSKIFSPYFDRIFLKPLTPKHVKEEWKKRFYTSEYEPKYMLIYLGQKRGLKATINQVISEVTQSELTGCRINLLADYKNSFEYVIATLKVLERLLKDSGNTSPGILLERLKNPLENRARRYARLNITLRLIKKIRRLERIKRQLNPEGMEGSRTRIIEHLELLNLFGFNHDELKEIMYIVLGHTAMGRILSGKTNEQSLQPILDFAKQHDLKVSLNLLRYCRLMTFAEIEAERGYELTREELKQLFDLYELAVRIVINKYPGLEALIEEEISSMGGIHNKVVRKILMMTGNYKFLENWADLKLKGNREKESLSDYDSYELSRIENVISILTSVEMFEEKYLTADALTLPTFYRKFLDIEFHGTGHLFRIIEGRDVIMLLWFTINAARNGLVNFNPIMSDAPSDDMKDYLSKISREVGRIDITYLEMEFIEKITEQLYADGMTFIAGTGFKLTVEPATNALAINYIDIDRDIERLELLCNELSGDVVSAISEDRLRLLEKLFVNLDSFYQSYLRSMDKAPKILDRQKRWFKRISKLKERIRTDFLGRLFRPESFYSDFNYLHVYTPNLLNFIIPELGGLQGIDFSWHIYMKSPVINYILSTLRKLQALITRDRGSFQDADYMHNLAKREFGAMATGTVGISEPQIDRLEEISARLRKNNPPLFNALLRAFVFQDIGRLPYLRARYKDSLNSADLGETGAMFLKKEKIPEQYDLNRESAEYLVFLVRYHSLIHHIIRGEMSFFAISSVLEHKDKDLLDCFLVFSLIMLSAIRDDLVLEDLVRHIFKTKEACDRIIDGEITLEEHMNNNFVSKGYLYYALKHFKEKGLPSGVTPLEFLKTENWIDKISREDALRAGEMIYATERLFCLRGIIHVEFSDIVHHIMHIPIQFIYRKRKFSSIGMTSFERELFEALRIYKTLQDIDEEIRHYLLHKLAGDRVRIFGYEKVSEYLSYTNQIKLLLVSCIGSDVFNGTPVLFDFLTLCQEIEKRYEAVNDYFNTLSMKKIWEAKENPGFLFSNTTGIVLKKDVVHNTVTIAFKDSVNISGRLDAMEKIDNINELKKYYHDSLLELKAYPFNTEDYEESLLDMFHKKFVKITDDMLNQAKNRMAFIGDFRELHNLVTHLADEATDIGMSEEQRHKLFDLYNLRKEELKKEKLDEIEGVLKKIKSIAELNNYWGVLKLYLKNNRQFFGKEFETLVAKRLDEEEKRLRKD